MWGDGPEEIHIEAGKAFVTDSDGRPIVDIGAHESRRSSS